MSRVDLQRESAHDLAVAIVTTVAELSTNDRRGPLHDAVLASSRVRAALPTPLVDDPSRGEQLLCEIAIHLARNVLDVWSASYPRDDGPVRAVEAAEAWATCPCAAHADAASMATRFAVDQAQRAWPHEPKAAAWAGRIVAWSAAAPKYHWQAVAAIHGACQLRGVERVVAIVEAFLASASAT